jgi:hypothetical protein
MAPEPVPRSTAMQPPSGELVDGEAGHHLGLRARDQHPGVDEQVEGAEPPGPEDVLEGLAGQAPGDHAVDRGHLALGGGLVEGEDQLGRGVPGGALEHPPGLLAGVVDARRGQPLDGLVPQVAQRQEGVGRITLRHPASFRRVACSSATSASTTSSSSPASTLSSL